MPTIAGPTALDCPNPEGTPQNPKRNGRKREGRTRKFAPRNGGDVSVDEIIDNREEMFGAGRVNGLDKGMFGRSVGGFG